MTARFDDYSMWAVFTGKKRANNSYYVAWRYDNYKACNTRRAPFPRQPSQRAHIHDPGHASAHTKYWNPVTTTIAGYGGTLERRGAEYMRTSAPSLHTYVAVAYCIAGGFSSFSTFRIRYDRRHCLNVLLKTGETCPKKTVNRCASLFTWYGEDDSGSLRAYWYIRLPSVILLLNPLNDGTCYIQFPNMNSHA